uniref:Plancitoxin-1-like isoform X1 n=1 Tax=Crassostrea virginica TaxID=6565 RepID=A0A8B8DEM6_CRAVI|nr:plancitoxin-1-like isoform X1 [Crassostrea virginica]
MGFALGGLLVILTLDLVFCFQCIDPAGKLVDWYVMYKVPKATEKMPKKSTGREFYYIDATNPTWTYKDVDIQKPKENPLYHTLQQIYSQKPEEYAMYNDQCPPKAVQMKEGPKARDYSSSAHMKGAYAFQGDYGFWLILSVPQFPAPRKYNYSYGQSEVAKAQTVLCVSLHRKDLPRLEKVLKFTKPIYCDGGGPVFEHLTNMGQMSVNKTMTVEFISVGGQAFREYAKSAEFGKDLYDSLVAVELQDDLAVETWHPGCHSTCGQQKVLNVQKVEFANEYWFPSSVDHAKWAVTEKKEWTCIGDINRTKSQFKRGGGTMCFHHAKVANQFRSIIKTKEKCNKGMPCYNIT